MHELLLNEQIYDRVTQQLLPSAEKFVWIATADIKDMHVEHRRKTYDTILAVFADLVRNGVDVRLIHAKEPGVRFREDFDRFPELIESDRFERVLCPRNHSKIVIIDGKIAFIGSANLTGAGMGAKRPNRRNFESGFLTDNRDDINKLMGWFDELYIGDFCRDCGRREYCPDPIV